MEFSIIDILSVFMVLFAVIDIFGSIPLIIDMKAKGNKIEAGKTTLISFLILTLFLFVGEALLKIFGVDIESFAIAGSFIIFFLALEMVLGIEVFKGNTGTDSASVVPLAFPIIAGAGSITTLLSLRAEYSYLNIMIALLLNMIVVFIVLRTTKYIEKMLGQTGITILRKIFGIILLSIAIKLFMSNIASSVATHFPGLIEKLGG
ncbi:MAG: NAAT family transporter [Bacteroidales bacterium]|nr:NAAT family transporter [Bacteroidales bacterium]